MFKRLKIFGQIAGAFRNLETEPVDNSCAISLSVKHSVNRPYPCHTIWDLRRRPTP